VEVDVGHVRRMGPRSAMSHASSKSPERRRRRLLESVARRGQKAARNVVDRASAAKAAHGGIQVTSCGVERVL